MKLLIDTNVILDMVLKRNDYEIKQVVNAIYDSGNYMDIFERDVVEAEKKIIVSSLEITQDKIERFVYLVQSRQEAGVVVTVITTEPQNISYGNSEFCQRLIVKMQESGIHASAR